MSEFLSAENIDKIKLPNFKFKGIKIVYSILFWSDSFYFETWTWAWFCERFGSLITYSMNFSDHPDHFWALKDRFCLMTVLKRTEMFMQTVRNVHALGHVYFSKLKESLYFNELLFISKIVYSSSNQTSSLYALESTNDLLIW